MATERVGFIGLGNMGLPMALNLEKAGFDLSVYNRTVGKTDAFKSSTKKSATIEELVSQSDIIITMLTNDASVEEVYTKALSVDVKGKLFIDMSTVSQQLSVSLSEKLKAHHASLLDAPVAGSTKPAADGTLIIMVGGESSDLERAMPYFEKMGRLVKHLGANGKGLAAKIAINYFLSILYQGLAEGVLVAEKLGVERSALLDIINESAVGSGATKIKTPLLNAHEYQPAFALDLMLKDVLLAKSAGAVYPLGAVAIESYKEAQNKGLGTEDVIGIIRSLS